MCNEELVQEYQNGNQQALDGLIENNEGLIFYFANKYSPICPQGIMDKDDLIQEGRIALVNAASKYNSNESIDLEDIEDDEPIAKFSTYAGIAIKSKMLRSINRNIAREKKSDIESEPIRLNSINKLLPGSEDTSLEMVIPDDESMEDYKDIDKSIDNEILRKDLLELLDSVFGSGFEFNGIDFSGIDNMNSLFSKINEGINAKEVLLLHYGLFDKPMTYKEIGKKVHLSSSRIEQIEHSGIKAIINSYEGQDFMDKYEIDNLDILKTMKESINQYDSPERVTERLETIDNLLKQYI